MKRGIENFFRYARERQQIHLRRLAGEPRPWTRDPILQKYRFCCVFREDDRTTRWFRECVRDPLRDKSEVLLATVVFRLLNRVEVGEAIFLHDSLLAESSSFYELVRACRHRDAKRLIPRAIQNVKRAVHAFVGERGPHATGAYIISSPPGFKKLEGILWVVENFCLTSDWINCDPVGNDCSLEEAWEWFKQFDYFGPFHSYEIVTDLRHTALLERASDIMTWANPGPGCRRGLNRTHGRELGDHPSRAQLIDELQEIVHLANTNSSLWPREWPRWEMREGEHVACEVDKMMRTKNGEGRPRGVYR